MLVVNLYGGPGVGKCLAKGTGVLMYSGMIKKVEDILIGDLLMGPDSTPRTVLELHSGTERLYEVTPTKGEAYRVTGNHILPLKLNKDGKEKDVFVQANSFSALSSYKQARLKQWRVGIDYIGAKEVLIDPYYLGLWLGDGHTKDPTKVTTIDSEITEWLSSYAVSIGMKFNKVGNSITYSITNGQTGGAPSNLRNGFTSYGLYNNKHIPDVYKYNTRNTRLKVLAGLIDSDGYVNNGCVTITQKSKRLLDDIVYIARSLGFAAYKTKVTKSCPTRNGIFTGHYYHVNISGDLISIPTILPRKQFVTRIQIKSVLRTGLTVKLQEHQEEYYGFEVDGDNLFLLEDFTVTHNSTTAAQLFYKMKKQGYKVELVTEYAKDLVYSEEFFKLKDQLMVFAKQHHKLWKLRDKVDYAIVDSPLPLSLVYAPDDMIYNYADLSKLIMSTYTEYDNEDFFLTRDLEAHEYQEYGRNQTIEEACSLDDRILEALVTHNIQYRHINYKTATDEIIQRLGL